jgi:hypothetical protein
MTPACTSNEVPAQSRSFSTRAQIALAACACGGGATRALYALLHGRMLDALHDNALFIATLPLILYALGTYTVTAWRANAWPTTNIEAQTLTRRGVTIIAALISFMIARNLPGWPFEWLRPL